MSASPCEHCREARDHVRALLTALGRMRVSLREQDGVDAGYLGAGPLMPVLEAWLGAKQWLGAQKDP